MHVATLTCRPNPGHKSGYISAKSRSDRGSNRVATSSDLEIAPQVIEWRVRTSVVGGQHLDVTRSWQDADVNHVYAPGKQRAYEHR